jgi:hypothetical protein
MRVWLLLKILLHPIRYAQDRIDAWVLARVKRQPGPVQVPRYRVYILPTRFGYGFALLVMVMVLAAMNYSNSMAFALAFMLAGLGLVAMNHTHGNLVNVEVRPGPVDPVFAGEVAHFEVHVRNPAARGRHALSVGWPRQPVLASADVAPGGDAVLKLPVAATRRGWLPARVFAVSTEFPLGMFHAWTWLELEMSCLVYPRPAAARRRHLPHRQPAGAGRVRRAAELPARRHATLDPLEELPEAAGADGQAVPGNARPRVLARLGRAAGPRRRAAALAARAVDPGRGGREPELRPAHSRHAPPPGARPRAPARLPEGAGAVRVMKPTTAEDYLAQASLLRLLAVLALVVAPHFAHMPFWMSAATAAIALWRAAGALRQWPLPPRWLKVALVLAGFVGVQLSYGRVNGQHAGAALLVLMLALKLTEMRSRRDVLVVVSLCYFTMLTHFLFSQELWTILYLFACAIGVTALLIEANHPGGVLPVRLTLRRSAALVAQSLPLMVAFFILFPRVPGPLWGLPADAGAARSGISDTMSPGDISQLIESDEVAFRVQFAGAPPPPRDLYWRGPVLSYFDGTRWRAPFRGDDYFRMYAPNARLDAYEDPRAELRGEPVRYQITLQPHRQNWLFALDLPHPDALPPGTQLTGYYQLLSRELVKDVARYELVSHPDYRLEPDLAAQWQRSASRLPEGRNPRAVALARQWRDEGLSAPALVERALRMFREQEFFYTLEPPRLGADFVDEFLFGSRRGFC